MFAGIRKNVSYLVIAQLIASLFFVLHTLFVAFFLGVQGLGIYAFIFAICYIASTLANLGLKDTITRNVAQRPAARSSYIRLVLKLKSITLLPYFFLVFLLFLLFKRYHLLLPLCIGSTGILVESFLQLFYGFFRAEQKMKYEGATLIVQSGTTVVSTIVLLFLGVGLLSPFIGNLVGNSIGFCLGFWFMRTKTVPSSLSISTQSLLKESMHFLILEITALLIYRIDILMLTFLKNNSATGIYEAGYMIIKEIELIPYLIAISFYPLFAFQRKNKTIYNKSFQYLLFTAIAITIGLFLFGKLIISLLYGPDFEESVLVLRILTLGSFFLFINYGNYYYLHARKKSNINVIVFLCAIAINILLNFFFIPRWSYVGSAIATGISYAFIMITEFSIVQYLLKCEKNG